MLQRKPPITVHTGNMKERIRIISDLLEDNQLKPMFDFDDPSTENFVNDGTNIIKPNEQNDEEASYKSSDTRKTLNKRNYDFGKVISRIGSELVYIKSGANGHTFKGSCITSKGETNYAIKVVPYPKHHAYGGIHNSKRPENVELMIIKLLSYFVINRQIPHIVLPMGTFDTSITTFVDYVKNIQMDPKVSKKYKEFIDEYKEGTYYDQVSVLISEWANRGDFLEFIRKYGENLKPIQWKSFFFQIIATLAIIQYKYPSFRHNDLKPNNILVNKIAIIDKSDNIHKYTIVGTDFIVPNVGYQLLVWDFDFACIPGLIDNLKVNEVYFRNINVVPEMNRYYDMHYFFNTLMIFYDDFLTSKNVPQDAKDFVTRIVPPKYQNGRYVNEKGRILIADEYFTPYEVLRSDAYFEEFRVIKNTNINTDILESYTLINKMNGSVLEQIKRTKKTKTRKQSKNNNKRNDIVKQEKNNHPNNIIANVPKYVEVIQTPKLEAPLEPSEHTIKHPKKLTKKSKKILELVSKEIDEL